MFTGCTGCVVAEVVLQNVIQKVQGTPVIFNRLHGNATNPLNALIAWMMNGDVRLSDLIAARPFTSY